MSISTDDIDMETEAGPYSDHEHINLAFSRDVLDGTQFDSFNSFEPLAGELESNEVAELVFFRANYYAESGGYEFGVGFNVSDDDFLEQAPGNNPTAQSGVFDGEGNVALYEEPGVIDFVSSGQQGDDRRIQLRTEIDYKDTYHSGPFIDSTDDLDLHVEANNGSGNPGTFEVQMQFVYKIHEVAQGIPQFANPMRLSGD